MSKKLVFVVLVLCIISFLSVNALAADIEAKTETSDDQSGFSILNSSSTGLLRVRSDGNVGIGTTSPSVQLDARYPFSKTDVTWRNALRLGSNDASNPFSLFFAMKGAANQVDRAAYIQTAEDGISNGGTLSLQPSGGNVGIGTTTPNGLLHVWGANDYGVLIGKGSGGGNTIDGAYQAGYSTLWLNSISSYDILMATGGGNVGIGTTTTGAKLHVAGSDPGMSVLLENTSANFGRNYIMFKSQGSDRGYIGLGSSSDNNLDIASYGAANIDFTTNSSPRMIILANGNVGIGTTGPANKLHVLGGSARVQNGNVIIQTTGNSHLSLQNASDKEWRIFNSDTDNFLSIRVYGTGESGDGVFLEPGNQLWSGSSDIRLKENIVPVDNALSKVMQLRGVYFNFKTNPDKRKKLVLSPRKCKLNSPNWLAKTANT